MSADVQHMQMVSYPIHWHLQTGYIVTLVSDVTDGIRLQGLLLYICPALKWSELYLHIEISQCYTFHTTLR